MDSEEIEKCKQDPYYYAVKYLGVPDTELNKQFYDLVMKAKKEGKSIIISKKRPSVEPFPFKDHETAAKFIKTVFDGTNPNYPIFNENI